MKKKLLELEIEEMHAKSLVPAKRKVAAKSFNRTQNIPKKEHWKLIYLLSFIICTIALISLSPTILPSVLISILFFFVFRPIIDSFERKGISRTSSILAVFLICGLGLGLLTTKIVPKVSQEIDAFQQGSSRYGSELEERLRFQEKKSIGTMPFFRNLNATEKGISWMRTTGDKLWNSAPNIATHLMVALILVPFLTFLFLKDGNGIRRRLLGLVPNRYFETFYSISYRIVEEMGGYVAAKIIEAFIVATIVTLCCLILNIPYGILLGVIAGAMNPIPYIGPLIGALPGLLLAVIEPSIHNQIIWVGLIYLLANVMDMFVIFPMVVAKIVNIHPVLVVISVILGSQMFGIVGMIVAVPIASILKILIQEFHSRIYTTSADFELF